MSRFFGVKNPPVTYRVQRMTDLEDRSESLGSSCDQSKDRPSDLSSEPGPSDLGHIYTYLEK